MWTVSGEGGRVWTKWCGDGRKGRWELGVMSLLPSLPSVLATRCPCFNRMSR